MSLRRALGSAPIAWSIASPDSSFTLGVNWISWVVDASVAKGLGVSEDLREVGARNACDLAGAPKDDAEVVDAFGLPAKVGGGATPKSESKVSASTEGFMNAAPKLIRLREKEKFISS